MFDIKRLLYYAYPEATVEVSSANNGIDQVIKLSNVEKKQLDYVFKIMEGAGFYPSEHNSETASLGVIEFTSVSPYAELAEDYDESETENLEDSGSNTIGSELSSADDVPIDGDGRAFSVLTTPDMHKFAMKVYTSMLGNTENMANYGIFAYDLDNFLSMHRNTNPSFDEEDDEGEEDGSPSVPEAAFLNVEMTVEEASSILFNSDVGQFYSSFGRHLPETANHKILTKIILGIIVKIIGGAVGKSLLDAWERKNKGAFERILFNIAKIILNDWFPTDEFTSYKSDVQKYNKYEFEDDHLYDIDLDDYEVIERSAYEPYDLNSAEVALKPVTVGILRLLIAVMIKIMAGALGRMLTDAWIKRDKKKFERTLMYFFLQVIKYTPFRESANVPSIEVFDDGSVIDTLLLEDNTELEGSETARKKKEKKGRGALLSALMRALSGDRGDRAARAWDNGDPETMGEIMAQVAEKVIETMPYDEEKYPAESEDEPITEDAPSEATT